jgi:hypothetical protein
MKDIFFKIKAKFSNGRRSKIYLRCEEYDGPKAKPQNFRDKFSTEVRVTDIFLAKADVRKDRYIQELVIPAYIGAYKISSIGAFAFSVECDGAIGIQKVYTGIQNLILSDGIREIENNAFYGLNVTHVRWPSTCKIINLCAFEASTLESIENVEHVTTVGANAFGHTNLLTSPDLKSCSEIMEGAFGYCHKLKSFNWPAECTLVPTKCFMSNRQLQEVTGMENVKIVEAGAFSYTGLKSFDWPEGCTVIPDGCFRGATHLTEVNIPDTLTTIESEAFAETKLKELDLSSFFVVDIAKDSLPPETKVTLPFYQ